MAILNHPEHHQETLEETLGAGVQQQPMQESQAKPQDKLSEDEKKALQIHNQGRLFFYLFLNARIFPAIFPRIPMFHHVLSVGVSFNLVIRTRSVLCLLH